MQVVWLDIISGVNWLSLMLVKNVQCACSMGLESGIPVNTVCITTEWETVERPLLRGGGVTIHTTDQSHVRKQDGCHRGRREDHGWSY